MSCRSQSSSCACIRLSMAIGGMRGRREDGEVGQVPLSAEDSLQHWRSA